MYFELLDTLAAEAEAGGFRGGGEDAAGGDGGGAGRSARSAANAAETVEPGKPYRREVAAK